MADRRKKLLSQLVNSSGTTEEQILVQLTIERICADMCDFYERFYAQVGPGALVYIPDAGDEENSMFYLSVDQLIAAQEDLRKKDQEEPAQVMQKAIALAESIDASKEAIFIINDKEHMALIRYNRERPLSGPISA